MSVLTNKDFTEALPSSLDLFEMPPYQTSIMQHYYVDVRPMSTITDSSPVEFLISNGGSDYIDLKRTRLHVKLRVIHADGSVLADKEKVGPVNLFLQSLWSQVAVYMQGQLISSSNGGYPYKAIMQTLLGYGEEAKSTQLQSQLFYKDTGETTAEFDDTDNAAGGNDGLIFRSPFIALSQSLTMSGPLMEDVFHLNRHLVNGVDVNIKLFRSSVPFALMSAESGMDYKIELQDVYLKVCKLKMNNALVLAHAKQFEKANALYPFTKTEIRQASISASQMSHTMDNLFLDHCPTRVIVGFVAGSAVSGVYTKNPFTFDGTNIKTVGLYLDGVSVPGRPVEADDIEAYVNLFEGTNTWREDTGNNIERKHFQVGNALFVFNLEPLSIDDSYLNLIQSGNLRLEIQFKTALTSTISAIVTSFSPALMEIDQQRNVFVK